MYINSSDVYPSAPGSLNIMTYVRDNVSSLALETMFEDVVREGDAIPPVPLEDALDYEYKSVFQLPWLSCEPINLSAVRSFLPEMEKAIDIFLTREVLSLTREVFDQPDEPADFMDILNVTVEEDLGFTYQKRFSALLSDGTEEVINTSKPLSGELEYIAWAGAIDSPGLQQNMSDMFLNGWPLERAPGEVRTMLDGSLNVVWRNSDDSGLNASRCQLFNASVEVDVDVSRGLSSLWVPQVLDMGPSLSDSKAMWKSGVGNTSWVSLALNSWMNPLYRRIQGMSLYVRESGSHETWADTPLEYPRDSNASAAGYADAIETLSHQYALSLTSGNPANPNFW